MMVMLEGKKTATLEALWVTQALKTRSGFAWRLASVKTHGIVGTVRISKIT